MDKLGPDEGKSRGPVWLGPDEGNMTRGLMWLSLDLMKGMSRWPAWLC